MEKKFDWDLVLCTVRREDQGMFKPFMSAEQGVSHISWGGWNVLMIYLACAKPAHKKLVILMITLGNSVNLISLNGGNSLHYAACNPTTSLDIF